MKNLCRRSIGSPKMNKTYKSEVRRISRCASARIFRMMSKELTPKINGKSKDEQDLQEWSTNKINGGEQTFSKVSSQLRNYAYVVDMHVGDNGNGRSYKDVVIGQTKRKVGEV